MVPAGFPVTGDNLFSLKLKLSVQGALVLFIGLISVKILCWSGDQHWRDYRKDGMDENVLKQIHSPIGIQIKSQTPEEIAISNAAEIIKAKNFRLAFFILNYISFYRRVIIFDLSVYNYLIKVTFYTGCNIHIFYILNMKVQMRLR